MTHNVQDQGAEANEADPKYGQDETREIERDRERGGGGHGLLCVTIPQAAMATRSSFGSLYSFSSSQNLHSSLIDAKWPESCSLRTILTHFLLP
jgi:hypothetical protein